MSGVRFCMKGDRMRREDRVIRLYGLVGDSIVDGPGLRFSVFVQGCSHRCPGCHNPESQPEAGGYERTVGEVLAEIESNGLVKDVTLSGGEPFEQCEACIALAELLKERGYGVWAYSGYLYEELAAGIPDPAAVRLLDLCDVLVDGPYVEPLSSYELVWKGSSNQRIVDLAKSRKTGSVVEWSNEEDFPEPPLSW